MFALAFMLAMGGSVVAGKALGEGDEATASDAFTKVMLICFLLAASLCLPALLFLDELTTLLGANDETRALVQDYLIVTLIGAPASTAAYALYYFVMVDGRPVLASSALVIIAVVNISLDWLLIAEWQMNTLGAALATVSSHLVLIVLLLPHFFSKKAKLKFVRPNKDWSRIKRAALNGISEFTNEMSSGIITLMFNWVLISRFSTDGVAAFTVVGYVMFIAVMLSYGFGDAAQPLISKNLGARKPARIYSFLRIALISTFVCNAFMAAALLAIPDKLIGIFLQDDALSTMHIAQEFARFFWIVPVLIGTNVVLTAFFTASDQPLPSGIISVARSLILPAALLFTLPKLFGDVGIYVTVAVAESIALILALVLLWRSPSLFATRPTTEKEQDIT